MLMMTIPDVEMSAVLVCSMVVIYWQGGTNAYSSRDKESDGIGQVYGLKDLRAGSDCPVLKWK